MDNGIGTERLSFGFGGDHATFLGQYAEVDAILDTTPYSGGLTTCESLLMGVPGLAKTLLISRLAETMSLSFSRIQFTPDLMPMDITGTDILQELPGGKRALRGKKEVKSQRVRLTKIAGTEDLDGKRKREDEDEGDEFSEGASED